MTDIILYSVVCYLLEIGITLGNFKGGWLSLILAPIFAPIEIGAMLMYITKYVKHKDINI